MQRTFRRNLLKQVWFRSINAQFAMQLTRVFHRFRLIYFAVSCDEDVSHNLRYLNCTGDDHPTRHSFHTHSFIANDEIKLIESNGKKFHHQKLFDLDFSENVLTDSTVLQSLLGKARWSGQTQIVIKFSAVFWFVFNYFVWQNERSNAVGIIAREQYICNEKKLLSDAATDDVVPLSTTPFIVHRPIEVWCCRRSTATVYIVFGTVECTSNRRRIAYDP